MIEALLVLLSAILFAGGFLTHALLRDLRDARLSLLYLARRHRQLSACLSETLSILSSHYPLRNEQATLELLKASVDPKREWV